MVAVRATITSTGVVAASVGAVVASARAVAASTGVLASIFWLDFLFWKVICLVYSFITI